MLLILQIKKRDSHKYLAIIRVFPPAAKRSSSGPEKQRKSGFQCRTEEPERPRKNETVCRRGTKKTTFVIKQMCISTADRLTFQKSLII